MKYSATHYAHALYALTQKDATGNIDEVTDAFLATVASNGDQYQLRKILRLYQNLLVRHNAFPEVVVTIPEKGNVDEEKLDAFCQQLAIPHDIKRTIKVDANLIGGVRLRYNNLLVDYSLQQQLRRMKKHITSNK